MDNLHQSINSIIKSQTSVLEGLKNIYCDGFLVPLKNDTTLSSEDKLQMISQIINTISEKENSTSNIINSLNDISCVDDSVI